MAREITQAAAQSVHEYVWRVKWDQGQRNGRLGRSNSHPPDRESCLTSQRPPRWRAGKLLHCTIDPDVVFWSDDLKSYLNAQETGVWEKVEATQGERWTEIKDCSKTVAGKRDIFLRKNLAVHLLLRRNWFHVFSYERHFSFCCWGSIQSTLFYYKQISPALWSEWHWYFISLVLSVSFLVPGEIL